MRQWFAYMSLQRMLVHEAKLADCELFCKVFGFCFCQLEDRPNPVSKKTKCTILVAFSLSRLCCVDSCINSPPNKLIQVSVNTAIVHTREELTYGK